MRAVNLLPKDAERAARLAPNPALLVGAAGFAVAFAVLFPMYFSARQDLADKQASVQQLEIQQRLQKPTAKPLPIQQQLASAEPQRKQAMSAALSYRLPWDVVLGQIARALPRDVSLTSLTAQAPVSPSATPSSVPGPQTGASVLRIEGYGPSQEAVALVMSRLSVLPALSDVVLIQSQRADSQAGPSIYNFSISASLKQPGVAS